MAWADRSLARRNQRGSLTPGLRRTRQTAPLTQNVRVRHERHALPSQVRIRIGERDYYQVAFENTDPAGDAADVRAPDSPYELIQRQFEDPDGGDATLKPMTKDTLGIFAYVRLSSVHLASFLK